MKSRTSKVEKTILGNISANLLIKVITFVFSFLTVVYVARVLQPEAYGKINFISSFTGYFIMLANLGMPIYAMRLCSEKKNDRKSLSHITNELWSINILLSSASLVLLLATVLLVPRFQGDRLLFFIYGCGILFQAFGFEWLFKGLEEFKFLAICQLIAKALSLVCMLLFVHSDAQLSLYAVLSVFAAYGSNVLCFLTLRKHVNLSFHIRINPIHFKPLIVFFLMSCAVSIYNSLDITMIGLMKTDFDTGLYSIAAKGKGVLTVIGGIVWTSILPQATRLWKEGKRARLESLACKSIVIVTAIQLLVMVICLLFAREIVVLIGGNSYAGAQYAFRILLLSLVPIGMSNIIGGQVLIPAGKERFLLYAEITGAALNFIANLFIIPLYSIEGAAATTVASEVVVTMMCLHFARRELDMDFGFGLLQRVVRKIITTIRKETVRMTGRICGDKLSYYCPCCDTHLREFKEGGYAQRSDRFNPARYEHTEQAVICPICGALPRHRILVLWCDENRELLCGSKILYFAPERSMSMWMRRNGIACTTADLFASADLQLDIQDTGLPDESFDVVICNHVLEHVDDFRTAIDEVHRILTSGGIFICSFPMDPKIDLLDEDPKVYGSEERLLRFGQYDHKRVFGMDAGRFLREAGFEVELIRGDSCPERILPVVGPADYDMNVLYCCRK